MRRVILLIYLLAACGKDAGSGVVACEMREGCDELEAGRDALDNFERMCRDHLGGVPSRDRCPKPGALGACTWRDDPKGAATTHWYYTGGALADEAAVRAHCEEQAWDFVAP